MWYIFPSFFFSLFQPSKFDPWFAFTLGVLWFAFNIIQTFRGLRKIKQNTEYLKKMKN